MSDKNQNNNDTLWVVGFVVGLGVLLWLVTQCSLSCASNQKENWGGAHVQAGMRPVGGIPPVRGNVNPSFFDINNFPNPDFTNLRVPLDREMQCYMADQVGEPNSDCMLTPGAQCHLASGGLGVCGPTLNDTRCYKTDATLFNMSSRTTGLPLSDEIKKKV